MYIVIVQFLLPVDFTVWYAGRFLDRFVQFYITPQCLLKPEESASSVTRSHIIKPHSFHPDNPLCPFLIIDELVNFWSFSSNTNTLAYGQTQVDPKASVGYNIVLFRDSNILYMDVHRV